MIPSNFLVLTKRQLEFSLSQGNYFPSKCNIEEDLTKFILNDTINKIMDPKVSKIRKLHQKALTRLRKQRKVLNERASRYLDMSNKITEKIKMAMSRIYMLKSKTRKTEKESQQVK